MAEAIIAGALIVVVLDRIALLILSTGAR